MRLNNGDLEKLKELTESLKPLHELIKDCDENAIEYETIEGTLLGFGLYKSSDIAVQRIFMSKGSKIDKHIHEEAKEIGIVYKGKLIIKINNEEKVLEKGDIVYFNPKETHSARAEEDTWSLWITIPPSLGYPGKNK